LGAAGKAADAKSKDKKTGGFGNGYGSECHLLRYLGRHRDRLNAEVCRETGGSDVRWLDFPFAKTWPGKKGSRQWPDAE